MFNYLSGNIGKDKAKELVAIGSEVFIQSGWKGSIEACAFEGISNLKLLDANEITAIRDSAFKDCTRLSKLVIPNVEDVGENVFENCYNLNKVDVKNENMAEIIIKRITECGLEQRVDIYVAGKFEISIKNNCEYLFNDTIPYLRDGVRLSVPHYPSTGMKENVISAGAFKDIDYIRKVNADATTIIEENAFEGCGRLEKIFLSSVKEIGNEAFKDCILLNDVYVNESMAGRVKELLEESNLSQQVYIRANDGTIIDYLHNDLNRDMVERAVSYEEPWIGKYTNVPEYYVKINKNTFNVPGITSIDTNKVTVLEDDVCTFCNDLIEIHLPNVQEIGDDFCRYCPNLKRIRVKDEAVANLIKNMFDSYNQKQSSDINIYIGNNNEPFLIIQKDKCDQEN